MNHEPVRPSTPITREPIRREATRVVSVPFVLGMISGVIFFPGDPRQSTILLATVALSAAALYGIEVWARTGRVRP